MLQPDDRRTSMIIWGALVAGVSMFYAVVVFVIPPLEGSVGPELADTLLLVAAALSVVTVATSWLWVVRMRLPARPGAAPLSGPALARTRLIVACAICEGPALFAMIVFLLSRDVRVLVPFALSYVALLAHFPGESHWARLSGTAPEGSGPNRMIRG